MQDHLKLFHVEMHKHTSSQAVVEGLGGNKKNKIEVHLMTVQSPSEMLKCQNSLVLAEIAKKNSRAIKKSHTKKPGFWDILAPAVCPSRGFLTSNSFLPHKHSYHHGLCNHNYYINEVLQSQWKHTKVSLNLDLLRARASHKEV